MGDGENMFCSAICSVSYYCYCNVRYYCRDVMWVIEWTNKSNPLLSTRGLASRLSDRVRCVYSRQGRLERQKESSSDSD